MAVVLTAPAAPFFRIGAETGVMEVKEIPRGNYMVDIYIRATLTVLFGSIYER